MKKYAGARVWKSFQLVITTEIDLFENKNLLAKKTHHTRSKRTDIKKQNYIYVPGLP